MEGSLNPRYGDRRRRLNINCMTCNKDIECYACRPRKFCSKKCYFENDVIKRGYTKGIKNEKLSIFKRNQVPRVKKTCNVCEDSYFVKNSRDNTSKFCSTKCLHIHQQKENHPTWKGGKSYELYGVEFDNNLKKIIRQRDNLTCQECLRDESSFNSRLSIHHIDYNKKNNLYNNLISLCKSCHTKTNWNRDHWEKYFKMRVFIRELFNPNNLLTFNTNKQLINITW